MSSHIKNININTDEIKYKSLNIISNKNTMFEIKLYKNNQNFFSVKTENINIFPKKIYENPKIELNEIKLKTIFKNSFNLDLILNQLILLNSKNLIFIKEEQNYLNLYYNNSIDNNNESLFIIPEKELNSKQLLNECIKIIKETQKINSIQNKKINELEESNKNLVNEIDYLKKKINNLEKSQVVQYKIQNLINIKELKAHNNWVYCLLLLKDGRFASCSGDCSIKIFSHINYEIELNIKEHKNKIKYITQLKNENLISCSDDKTIKIFKIEKKNYKIIQILLGHKSNIFKVIEIINKKILISSSSDKTIKIWKKYYDNNKSFYSNISTLATYLGQIEDILQINKNEFVSSCFFEKSICFWDISKLQIICKINDIKCIAWNGILCLINTNYLIVGGNSIYIIDILKHELIREVENNIFVWKIFKFSENIIITSDNFGNIWQWIFTDKELQLVSKKMNIHNNFINSIIKLDNGMLVTCSDDSFIKIFN